MVGITNKSTLKLPIKKVNLQIIELSPKFKKKNTKVQGGLLQASHVVVLVDCYCLFFVIIKDFPRKSVNIKLTEDKVKKAVVLLLENEKDLSPLLAKDGLFKQFKKQLLERALNAEMVDHLGHARYQRNQDKNTRNGLTRKQLITENGSLEIVVPRDRESTFESQIVKKTPK